MKIIIVNGPNLNLLGKRETTIYGEKPFEEYYEQIKIIFPEISFEYFQSNIEGELINKIQETGFSYDGIILNAGGYSHTSVAISDAIAAISTPVIEVHISNIYAREAYRHESMSARNCIGVIAGFGFESYKLAIHYLISQKISSI